MKLSLAVVIGLLLAATPAFSELSEKEMVDLINRVNLRINGGEVNALTDLTTLPVDVAVPALLNAFKYNYNVFRATPLNKSIGAKAAQLLQTTPGAEANLLKLFKIARDDLPNNVYFQQDSAIKCLRLVNNKFSVRVLCAALAPTEIGCKAADALATMSLPDAPYVMNEKSRPSKPDGVAKWKAWWDAHKGNYSD